ncbi:hypothetical protein BLNAU_7428 [Blattamonas nauphoetae]|uniref:Uncharacterized protein n=1 Tax=Blattamonas nauphoetae TaxID=2049346 RepID=A0ABQ9Y1G0_9EUKA|nr:hypothetical protein BLNAU_7428 [Blattamonas nauphoetae]
MTMAGSVGKASRKEAKEREQVNADRQPVLALEWIRVSLTPSHYHRVVEMNWREKHEEGVHDSLPVSTSADETRHRFPSLSPTTPQMMTGCPLTLRQSQPQLHSRK